MLFALHLPNHTLSLETAAIATLVAICVGGAICRRIGRPDRTTLRLFVAVVGFQLLAQAVNFPLLDGNTSGHVLGTAVAALLLGPALGTAATALVLFVQCLGWNDGGLAALGANTLNMAVVAALVAAATFQFVVSRRGDALGIAAASALAGWASSVAAAAACATELSLSGIGPASLVGSELVGLHAQIGLIEAAVTAAVIVPSLVGVRFAGARWLPLTAAAAIAFVLAPLASQRQDALEATLDVVAQSQQQR